MCKTDELLPCLRQLLYKKKVHLLHRLAELNDEKIRLSERQRQMVRELRDIFPIAEFGDKYSICEILLPQNLKAHDDTQVSVAIGYVTSMLIQISDILDLTLRNPLKFQGSKSSIVCMRRNKEFPLHLDSSRENFDNGVALLNCNIQQIMVYCGLTTEDHNYILKNLFLISLYLS